MLCLCVALTMCLLYYINMTPFLGLSSYNHTQPSPYVQKDEEGGGFFAKRFGIVKQKDHNTAGRRSEAERLIGSNGLYSNGNLLLFVIPNNVAYNILLAILQYKISNT